ncbi:mechanosensitive ion channel-like protein [Paucimonas lemoignei]|uniref:Mechanosensitive ion channel-like protein n=1 Tax=Paucimonas lemoignei TaxID=29443 RepID=A0A4V2UJC9_PAULE|nr:mechanosensitive ion channel domain-containing protein [Paucimonas lemoignei]TCS39300.1 mechanosensitive ion channel-like protein [Paucimonas lemoignei]
MAALLLGQIVMPASAQVPAAPSIIPKPAAPAKTESQPVPSAPQAIPVHDIAQQAEASQLNLREIENRSRVSNSIDIAQGEISRLERETTYRLQAVRNLDVREFSLETIQNLDLALRDIELNAAPIRRDLTRAASQTERDLKELERLDGIWAATVASATAAAAPRDLLERSREISEAIAATKKTVIKDRAAVLALQVRATDIGSRISEVRELLAITSKRAVSQLFERDGPPAWNSEFWTASVNSFSADAKAQIENQAKVLAEYLRTHLRYVLLHFFTFGILVIVLLAARVKVHALSGVDEGLRAHQKMFDMPIVVAALLALLLSGWFYRDAPRQLWLIIGVLSTVPLIVFARRVCEPILNPLLFAIAGFYLADKARSLFIPLPGVYRFLILLEVLSLALVVLLTDRRMRRTYADQTIERSFLSRLLENINWAVLLFAIVILACGAAGYGALADFLLRALVASIYAGVVLYVLTIALDGLVKIMLHLPPLNYLAGVRRHRAAIAAQINKWLKRFVFIYWIVLSLEGPGLLRQAIDSLRKFWRTSFEVGSLHISVSGVLIFILILWATYQVSRLLRFFLEEEIFSRVRLDRGLPYAVSTTVHYAVLVTGLVLALAAIGVDMTKFTIVAGALTVGIGFGLQNIVNNFVSGLIVLFERPVNIGDTIQIDDIVGRVQHIGIRATVIQSTTGAEVIIPNGKLISDKVTNWTLSNQLRQVAVPIITKSDINVAQLKSTLLEVARQNRQVLQTPEPEVLFIKRGVDAFEFELRIWTSDLDGWLKVKSDLTTNINDALADKAISAEATEPPSPLAP